MSEASVSLLGAVAAQEARDSGGFGGWPRGAARGSGLLFQQDVGYLPKMRVKRTVRDDQEGLRGQ